MHIITLIFVVSTDMSFFVTSRGVNGGANLGGLAGADRHCQALAAAAGAGDRRWRAYLSTSSADARDRIGTGPWRNVRGVEIARDLEQLHSDRNGLDRHTALTELGQEVPGDRHDVLTGSDSDGRLARVDGKAATCADWTAKADGVARIGHVDRFEAASWGNKRFPRWRGSWSSEHDTVGCDAKRLSDTGGGGLFYCFAADPTFLRGLNVNHWLGDNLAPELLPRSLYGDDWFDEEDVAWIAKQGFDHLRIAVGGHYWVTKDGDLDETKVARFSDALGWAKRNGLGVVLTMTSFPGFRAEVRGGTKSPDVASPFSDETTRGDAAYVWWLVARRFANEGAALRFELVRAPGTEDIRAFNQETLSAIRRTNPTRPVYVIDNIAGDAHTIATLDFWEPESFSFQYDDKVPLQKFTDGEKVAALIDALRKKAGAGELYVNSWGVYRRADDVSAKMYIRTVRDAFAKNGIAWAIYDYHTGCAVRDANGRPTRVLEALGK